MWLNLIHWTEFSSVLWNFVGNSLVKSRVLVLCECFNPNIHPTFHILTFLKVGPPPPYSLIILTHLPWHQLHFLPLSNFFFMFWDYEVVEPIIKSPQKTRQKALAFPSDFCVVACFSVPAREEVFTFLTRSRVTGGASLCEKGTAAPLTSGLAVWLALANGMWCTVLWTETLKGDAWGPLGGSVG